MPLVTATTQPRPLIVRRRLRTVGLLACLCVGAAPVARSAVVPAALPALLRSKADVAAALAEPAASCVQRHDTDHVAFHGCIDWHSAAHGTWALVAYTAMTGDQRYQPLIDSILTVEKLASERKLLADQPRFEMPYGRAWFLRLALDYGRSHADGRLDPMADDVAASLLRFYLDRPPNPAAKAYRSSAWALINLHDYYTFRGNAAGLVTTEALIRANFIETGNKPCTESMERPEFMATCSNWAWAVSKVLKGDDYAAWLARFLPPSALFTPVAEANSDHENGLNFSRAWGYWRLYALTGEPAYADAYARHFDATYRDPALWKGDYGSVGHWVPQFGMMAIQPLFGRERD
ncbi:MAG: hypothetical protein RL490_2654 [Pseudomonadota bacterium]|jgi:hypothetical protein